MAIYGYGRVSRDEQTSDNQRQVIELQQKVPVDKWFEEHAVSGKMKARSRPAFADMLATVMAGDTIVFTRVDRIGRKASDVLTMVEGLLEQGIEVIILQLGNVPLSSPMGKVMLGVFAIFAENERDSIVERTKDGLARTKAQGTRLGRPLRIPYPHLAKICEERAAGVVLDSLSSKWGYDRNTILQAVKKWKDELPAYKELWEKQEKQAKERKKTA
jgi:putative DNA-invertase from lambdoid prophage Rac